MQIAKIGNAKKNGNKININTIINENYTDCIAISR